MNVNIQAFHDVYENIAQPANLAQENQPPFENSLFACDQDYGKKD